MRPNIRHWTFARHQELDVHRLTGFKSCVFCIAHFFCSVTLTFTCNTETKERNSRGTNVSVCLSPSATCILCLASICSEQYHTRDLIYQLIIHYTSHTKCNSTQSAVAIFHNFPIYTRAKSLVISLLFGYSSQCQFQIV